MIQDRYRAKNDRFLYISRYWKIYSNVSSRQRRGRGRGGRYRQYGSHNASSSQGDKNSDPFQVSILKFGVGSNFAVFKKKIKVFAERELKQLAKFSHTNEYYVPPAIVAGVQFADEDLDPVSEPLGFLREQNKQERALRIQLI